MSRRRTLRLLLPALAWMVLIYVLSSRPTLPTIGTGWVDRTVKSAAHFGEYAILALLLARWPLARGSRLSWRQAAAVVAFAALYALSDEYHQRFVPGRLADWADVAADCAGAGLAALLLSLQRSADLLRPILLPRSGGGFAGPRRSV